MVTIDDRLHDSPIAMNYLAEGTLEIEVASYWQIITAPIIHSGRSVKSPSADEECISQMNVIFEGRDNNDTQDAKFVSHIFTATIS